LRRRQIVQWTSHTSFGQETELQIHLTSLQFLSCAIALVIVAFLAVLALAAEIDRRRRKPPLFFDYLRSDFEREHPQQELLTEPDERNAHNLIRMKPHKARESNPPGGNWD
jgi:hypothetical protein